MKQFEDCNIMVKAWRCRYLLAIPFYMYKTTKYWKSLNCNIYMERIFHASVSTAFIKMRYFRSIM